MKSSLSVHSSLLGAVHKVCKLLREGGRGGLSYRAYVTHVKGGGKGGGSKKSRILPAQPPPTRVLVTITRVALLLAPEIREEGRWLLSP